jgi:hypothetical protein
LESIEGGSAKAKLVAILAGTQLLSTLPPEFDEAKDLINVVISTEAGHSFPSKFPKHLYSYFNRVGRSLEPGEAIHWTPGSQKGESTLTRDKRKRLVLAHRETYEDVVEIVGGVEEINARKRSGNLRDSSGELIEFVFDDPFFDELKSALGSKTTRVRVTGIGEFDVNDRLSSIIEIDQLEGLPHYALMVALEGLSELADGWLEGNGKAPAEDDLNWVADELTKVFPDDLGHPSVAPTEEGHVVLEWMRPMARIELEINFSKKKLELYATNLESGEFVEQSFELTDWDGAFNKVNELLG